MQFKLPQQIKGGGGGHLLEIRLICHRQKEILRKEPEEIQRKR